MSHVEIASERLALDSFVKVYEVQASVDGEIQPSRMVVDRPESVGVLLWHRDRKQFLLVRQLRPPMIRYDDPFPIEVVAGSFEPGEVRAEAAAREVEEETGYRTKELVELGCMYSSPGSYSERLWFYFAEIGDEDRFSEGGGIDDESVSLVYFTPEELEAGVESSQIPDAKTIIVFYRCQRNGLGPYGDR